MFSRILIANRGEIALRIIRACRELGIETVAVYSEADRDALHLRCADAAICIGPAAPASSYLNIPHLISAAEISDVEAIHPGYGFLAESAHFAEICESSAIAFIGPSPRAMKLLGDKCEAKRLAAGVGVPTVPGSDGPLGTDEEALRVAHDLEFPVIIKAAAGGGGRGMRVAHNDISLVNSLISARREAEASFKDGTIYLEKYIENPRHVEVQILGDAYGRLVHLGERDCSIQRRHQKLIEETPSPGIDRHLRERICEAALKIAKAAGYTNAGTVEFLVDGKGKFYFIEANARLQVEHPVTEFVTGIDIVKEQIRIAAGEPLSFTQRGVRFQGAAIECRVNAEDPADHFRPCPGRISLIVPPGGPGVRVDSAAYSGWNVPPHYDSLIAKLIVHKPTRAEAIETMRRALREYVVEGIKTTIPLYLEILGHSRFVNGDYDTGFAEQLVAG